MFGHFGRNLAPGGEGDSNPGPLGTKSRVLDHSAPGGHPPGESSPRGIIPLGNRPPGESSPWGIIPLGNHPPGESSPWGIVPLGNRPPGKSFPWGRPPNIMGVEGGPPSVGHPPPHDIGGGAIGKIRGDDSPGG